MPTATRVYLEVGKTWVFACAIDWPGWCRRGKGEEAALRALTAYRDRYVAVAGSNFRPGELEVVARVPGTATTDFGAPDARGEWDAEPLQPAEAARLVPTHGQMRLVGTAGARRARSERHADEVEDGSRAVSRHISGTSFRAGRPMRPDSRLDSE